ncbi:hypothetical protein VPH35_016144 [Triticum aestivum]|uniref:Uncharacterized protein n=1 Tax=Aegilops tauschii subsp. strangulata TaxID=200361 RepID=A0A452ZH61_AEGTS
MGIATVEIPPIRDGSTAPLPAPLSFYFRDEPSSSTFLLFPPPRHLGQAASGCRHRLCPGYKGAPLAGPLLVLLLTSSGPRLPPPRRALPSPLPLLLSSPGPCLPPPRRGPAGPLLLHPSSGPCVCPPRAGFYLARPPRSICPFRTASGFDFARPPSICPFRVASGFDFACSS